jgi:cell division septal protein FtsQ
MDRTFAARRPWSASPGEVLRVARGGMARALSTRRLRRPLIALFATAVVVTGGWLALRDSALVSVEHVRIGGLSGPEAREVRAALGDAARRQSTLHVRIGALRAAVAPYPVVRDLRVSTSFPHGLRITVVEQLPVAVLGAGSDRVAVAADGTLLGADLATSQMPVLGVSALPGRRAVSDQRVLSILGLLGAAPRPLASRITRVFSGPNGLTVGLRNGPVIYFGDTARPNAKWIAAASVLADPGSSGASYIDGRLPDRPAAGGIAGADAAQGGQVSAIDPTATALAANLALQVTGAPAPSPSAAGAPPAATSGTPTGTASTGAATGASTGTSAGTSTGTSAGSSAGTTGAAPGSSPAGGSSRLPAPTTSTSTGG